jgi:hypothetical protein
MTTYPEFNFNAVLSCYGVTFSSDLYSTLYYQNKEDKAVLQYNPIASPSPATMPYPYYKYSCALMMFKTNATTSNQYLLIYHVKGNAWAAFYLNGNLLKTVQVNEDQTIAFLENCPPSQTWWYMYMFLVTDGQLELKGIECYKL